MIVWSGSEDTSIDGIVKLLVSMDIKRGRVGLGSNATVATYVYSYR